jgi:hypothetical protein
MARFRKENKRIYYIVNDLKEEINLRVTSQNAKSLRLYNPVDGSIKEVNLPLSERMDGYTGLMFVEEVD